MTTSEASWVTSKGGINTSHSNGAVSGNSSVGGLMGANGGHAIHCYSTGIVSGGGEDVGGMIGSGSVAGPEMGEEYRGTVTASFWDSQTCGQTQSAGGTGKTTAEMQMAGTFLDAGWDFVDETINGSDEIWKISEGMSYPRLWWEKYSGGRGRADDPYQIVTAADLIALGDSPEDYDKHFLLTADIDLDPNLPGRKVFDKAVIAPDVNAVDAYFQGTPFTGVFDGNGHTISDLTVQGKDYVGLFGSLERWAWVKNLGVVDVNITSSGDYAGSLAGFNYEGSIAYSYGTGTLKGTSSAGVGGLIGSNGGSVDCCYSAGTVGGDSYVGGLLGLNCGDVSQCFSQSAVGCAGGWSVGGLVGLNRGTVTNCYSTGAIDGAGWAVGGLVGSNGGVVIYCHGAGAVSVTGREVGGLVGANYCDGHAGQTWFGDVTYCFWDVETSGRAISDGGIGKTTAEMHTARTFLDAGWDFAGEMANGTGDIWWILEGKDYPRLWWEAHD